jgi:hypothetical protein
MDGDCEFDFGNENTRRRSCTQSTRLEFDDDITLDGGDNNSPCSGKHAILGLSRDGDIDFGLR